MLNRLGQRVHIAQWQILVEVLYCGAHCGDWIVAGPDQQRHAVPALLA